MEFSINKLENLLMIVSEYFNSIDKNTQEYKISDEKWSKKEVLGHLVDSAIHNTVRFTEINYADKPYIYRTYKQNELVKINQYQSMDIEELLQLWLSLNKQIIRLFKSVNEEALAYEIKLNDGSIIDLRFLMHDYASHTEHHVNQILKL